MLEAQSLMSEQQPEPSADFEPVVDVNEETELVDPDPTTEEQVETTTEEQTETATPEPTETPAATDPDQPEVRGPIEFDSPEPQPDSPSNNQDDVSDNETAPDPQPHRRGQPGQPGRPERRPGRRRLSGVSTWP